MLNSYQRINIQEDEMKSAQIIAILVATALYSDHCLAGVFKCTDEWGKTSYQSDPCAKEKKAIEMDIITGKQTDLADEEKKQALEVELKKQQELIEQQLAEMEGKRKIDAAEQSAQNQQLIKDNPIQYSAYAIPPYLSGKLSELVKKYESRLPEIEKFRRLAAFKALASGECERVEADNLSKKSKSRLLVFSVDCSSAKRFYFNETELSE